MKNKKALLASVALCLFATPALADPLTVGTLVVNVVGSLLAAAPGAGVAALGTTAVSLIGTAVLAGASFGLNALLASGGKRPGQQAAVDTSVTRNVFEAGDSGQWRCMGRAKIGGVVIFGNTSDLVRYRLIARCKGPVDAVESYFMGTKEVTVEPNGDVSTPPFFSDAQSQVNIQSKTGDGSETSWVELQTNFPGTWTADHRARGVHQTLVAYYSPGIATAKYQRIFGSGFPDVTSIIRGELIYDPRFGINRWTDNGVVCCLHILLDQFKFPLSWFNLPFLIEQANKADQLVFTRTGALEKRSRCWGAWEEDKVSKGDLLSQVFLSTGCELVYLDGGNSLGIALVDDERESEALFSSKTIESINLRSGPEGVERPNVCKVRYYSPERDYEMSDVSLVFDQSASPQAPLSWSIFQPEIDKVGRKEVSYDLPFCPSASQAQRIARRAFLMERTDSGVAKFNLAGVGVWGARCIEIEHPDFGILKVEPSPPRIDNEGNSVEFSFRQLPIIAPWNPNLDEALAPQQLPDLGFSSTIMQPPPPIAMTRITRSASGGVVTRMALNAPPANISTVEITYRITAGDRPGPWLSMVPSVNSGFHIATASGGVVGQQLQVRERHFNAAGDGSVYSVIFNGILQVDTTPPAAGSITAILSGTQAEGVTVALAYEASSNLNVAGLLKGGSFSGLIDCDPGQKFTQTINLGSPPSESTFTYTITVFASSGVQSATASASVTTPSLS